MTRVIDLDDSGLSMGQVLDSIKNDGAFLRKDGKVIGRLEPADDFDLEEDEWAHAPEQIERGRIAREEYKKGLTISHEELKARIRGSENRPNKP